MFEGRVSSPGNATYSNAWAGGGDLVQPAEPDFVILECTTETERPRGQGVTGDRR